MQPAAQNNGCVLLGIIGFIILAATMCSKDNSPSTLSSSGMESPVSGTVLEARYVSARALNCRAQPATSGAVIGGLVQNERAQIVEHSGTWSKVRRASGDCWVASSFLVAAPVVATGAGAQGLMSTENAKSYAAAGGSSLSSSSRAKQSRRRSSGHYLVGSCPCSGSKVSIGPRGGRYCITSGGNKRYGV